MVDDGQYSGLAIELWENNPQKESELTKATIVLIKHSGSLSMPQQRVILILQYESHDLPRRVKRRTIEFSLKPWF